MPIRTEWVTIERDGGEMDTFIAHPAEPVGLGVVMLQEIFGVNDAMRRKAILFAQAGFTVAIPDLFWRLEKRVDLQYSEEERKKGFGLLQRFDFKAGVGDVLSASDHLRTEPDVKGKTALVGFCIGGKLAVVAGARQSFAAIVSFYGVKLDENLAEIDAIEAPLQVHVGNKDAHIPAETVEKLSAHLSGRANASVFVYPEAQHGFFNQVREDVYDSEAANLAKGRAFDILRKAAA
jgi:carboxymethylenebutenolidase